MKKNPSSGRRAVLLSVSFLSGIALLAAGQGLVEAVITHPAFRVREVEVRWPQGAPPRAGRFRLLPPESIFRVDLKGLTVSFQRRFPAAEVEEIRRILPNRLVAVLRMRNVVGQVGMGGLYAPISDEGILVGPAFSSPNPELPLLMLGGLKGPLRVGRIIDSPDFWKVSELLTALHRDGGIAGRRVASVRVEKDSLFLLLDSGVEVRFSGSRLAGGWQQLAGLVARHPEALTDSRYVDLRFVDPVIAGKTPNEKRSPRRRS